MIYVLLRSKISIFGLENASNQNIRNIIYDIKFCDYKVCTYT